jgi:UDP-N-acetylglucosamine--N-acetylmuramyl-(pentapeptide) pyrophosphoryl-undecaprenol N-acetylglucosamine transferase
MGEKKVLIAAGGSGGHLFPAQHLAKTLSPDAHVMIAGYKLLKGPFFEKKISFQEVASESFSKRHFLRFFFKLCMGCFQALQLMWRFSPDVVVGFGSYHSFPVLFAARVFRKKTLLFEANCSLGKVNRFFQKSAHSIGLQFPVKQKIKQSVFVPLIALSPVGSVSRKEALSYFGLEEGLLTILVFGGSQGAQFFNDQMPKILMKDCQVIHFTGGSDVQYNVSSCVKPFEKNMAYAYTASDLVICRCGASTIAELIKFQKPALVIPFPFASEDHQLENAKYFVETLGGGRMLIQKQATVERISEELDRLIQQKDQYEAALKKYKDFQRKSLTDWVLS